MNHPCWLIHIEADRCHRVMLRHKKMTFRPSSSSSASITCLGIDCQFVKWYMQLRMNSLISTCWFWSFQGVRMSKKPYHMNLVSWGKRRCFSAGTMQISSLSLAQGLTHISIYQSKVAFRRCWDFVGTSGGWLCQRHPTWSWTNGIRWIRHFGY